LLGGIVFDGLLKRFKRSQPWKVTLAVGVIERARGHIETQYAEGQSRRHALQKLDAFLAVLDKDPLKVMGHPPLGTDDPNVFRYSADPQATISAVADLDEARRELVVTLIKIKGVTHARHQEHQHPRRP
jgi:hypothetical protein